MQSEILILSDQRAGNVKQSIALAKAIGLNYQIKNIEFTIWSKLPNYFFLPNVSITKKSLKSLSLITIPKLIISCGRRCATVALYLKEKYNNLRVVQIMSPGIRNIKNFDLIILPEHDGLINANNKIIRIIGALSDTNHPSETDYNIPLQNFIGVLIGGNTKNYKISLEEINNFTNILKKITSYHHLSLFISFSRRTPKAIKKLVRNNFPSPHLIYDPESNDPNPYNYIISKAKFIIITADSISMCSEVATIGTPLYIYIPENFTLKKHNFFVQQLFDLQIGRKLDDSINYLEQYSYTPLAEVVRIAGIIKSKLLN